MLYAETFPGDVDPRRQAHRPRVEDDLCHHGGVARTPKFETEIVRAQTLLREVRTTSFGTFHDRVERWGPHAFRYYH